MDGRLLAGLTLASWVGVALTGSELILRLAYVLTAVLVLSAAIAFTSTSGLDLQRRTLSQRCQVGGWAEEWLRLTNRSWLPKLWLEVRDESELPAHRVSRVVSGLCPAQAETWFVRTRLSRRGVFHLGPVLLTGGDPLGLFHRQRRLPNTIPLTVYPAIVSLPGVEVPTGYVSGGPVVRRRAEYATTNIRGVRPYQPGDAFSRIHWLTTARRGRLYTKEFELDPMADFWILVDLDAQAHVAADAAGEHEPALDLSWLHADRPSIEPSTEEYAVTVAASMAHRILASGKSTGLIAFGQRRLVLAPDRGERQRTKILECLAVVRAVSHLRLDEVLALESHEFTRHTTLVVITPTTDSRWVIGLRELRLRGVESLVVLIEPASFLGGPSSESLRTALSNYGIAYHTIARDQLADDGVFGPVLARPSPWAAARRPSLSIGDRLAAYPS